MIDLQVAKPIGSAIALGVLWMIEGAAPMFEGRGGRMRHGAANLLLGLGNAAVAALVFAAATLFVTEWARSNSFGLLYWAGLPTAARIVCAVLIIDAWQYLWHRLNHVVPLLWRFHSVHHTDRDMDATTALRFHTGEIILSSTVRLAVLPLLGVTITEVLIYETILLPIILFHHSNVGVPASVDVWLRWLIVTPWMHWVHHSDEQPETDSNYSSVFSFWDRIFGSFKLRADPSKITLGLKDVKAEEWKTLPGMLIMPFRRRQSRRDSD